MRKLKFISLTVFVLILATSCERKEDETKAQEQIQVETEKPTQKQQELSEEVLQNLVDMGDKEDLIASGKIKPAPEFVEIDGKMVRTSPEKYESDDECGKARELFHYMQNNRLPINNIIYNIQYEDAGEMLYIMKDKDNIVRVYIIYSADFSYKFYDLKNELFFALKKKKYDYESDIKIFEKELNVVSKNIFLKQKNCIATFYKGKDF